MTVGDKTIPHENKVRAVVQSEAAETFVIKVGGTIAAPTAPGASYVQAEAASMKTAVDAIRAKLTESGLTA